MFRVDILNNTEIECILSWILYLQMPLRISGRYWYAVICQELFEHRNLSVQTFGFL